MFFECHLEKPFWGDSVRKPKERVESVLLTQRCDIASKAEGHSDNVARNTTVAEGTHL